MLGEWFQTVPPAYPGTAVVNIPPEGIVRLGGIGAVPGRNWDRQDWRFEDKERQCRRVEGKRTVR